MKYKILTSDRDARDFQAAVDRAEGLPRQESPETGARRIGKPPHVPWKDVWTRTHAEPRKNPSRDEWAYPVTDTVRKHEGKTVRLDDGTEVSVDTKDATDLDETWEADDVARQRVADNSNGVRS